MAFSQPVIRRLRTPQNSQDIAKGWSCRPRCSCQSVRRSQVPYIIETLVFEYCSPFCDVRLDLGPIEKTRTIFLNCRSPKAFGDVISPLSPSAGRPRRLIPLGVIQCANFRLARTRKRRCPCLFCLWKPLDFGPIEPNPPRFLTQGAPGKLSGTPQPLRHDGLGAYDNANGFAFAARRKPRCCALAM